MYIYIYIYIVCVCIWNFSSEMQIFFKKQIIIISCEWMPPKNPTRWVSEGCPLNTEWEVIERGLR